MKIANFDQANQVLKTYIPAVKEITGKDITLKRMLPLMKLLGNPEAKLKIIHIAGTSGKTSTAYYLASLLQASGQKVGLTISPHIQSVAERIQLDLKPLNEATFCDNLTQFLELINEANPRPTYYELLIAFAYWYFVKEQVDYAVIETGLGGLQDATNVASRPDKICVLTDIGLDHTKILGKTLKAIAAQKAGIIYPKNDVFVYRQGSGVMQVFRQTCMQQNAQLHEISDQHVSEKYVGLPLFQRRNWHLAHIVFNFITGRDHLTVLTEPQINAAMSTNIPARMEVISYKNKTIIIDGAHNPQKLRALLASINLTYPNQPVAVLAGFVRSRRPRLVGNLRVLLTMASHLVVTSFVPNQEMHSASANPEQVADYCEELGFDAWEIEPEPKAAFAKLLHRPEPILLVTGSFYLLHHIRPLIIKK